MQISKAICVTGMEMSHESWFWDAFHCPTEERNSKQSQRKQAIVKNCWSTKVLLVRNQCYQNVHLFTKVLQLKDYAHAGFFLSLPGYLPAASIYENIGWFQWLLPHCSFKLWIIWASTFEECIVLLAQHDFLSDSYSWSDVDFTDTERETVVSQGIVLSIALVKAEKFGCISCLLMSRYSKTFHKTVNLLSEVLWHLDKVKKQQPLCIWEKLAASLR